MIEFIIGAALGVGGMVAKDMLVGNGQQAKKADNNRQLEELYAENEKLRSRNKQAERQIEDLLSELKKLRRQSKADVEDRDDLDDELQSAKSKIKKLTAQNDELQKKVREYKTACDNYEQEIERLKDN